MKYKLTDQNLQTHMGCQWVVGEWVQAPGKLAQSLCSDGWIHFYDDPLLAVFFNPIHANIDKPRLWEIEIDGDTKVDATKGGARRARLLTELPLSLITPTQRVEIGIRCVQGLHSEPNFVIWAENWLNGTNRTKTAAAKAAWRAWEAAALAAEAGAWAAEATALAAEAAALAAEAAALAAEATALAAEATSEAWSAEVAAAEAAALAAEAAEAHQVLDILAVIKEVVG
jgi:hypothetical protein